MTLDAYIQLLASADDRIDAATAARLAATMDRLRTYAQSIAHRRTGNMANSMYRLGPFAIGGGILESQIASGASYAIYEIKRGGAHDWAGRTLEERQSLLDQLARETETIVLQAIGIR